MVFALDEGVPAVADMDDDLEVEDELDEEIEDGVDDVDEVAEVDELADVAAVWSAALTAMFAPSPRNAQTLSASATSRPRAAAWRRRVFFFTIGRFSMSASFACRNDHQIFRAGAQAHLRPA